MAVGSVGGGTRELGGIVETPPSDARTPSVHDHAHLRQKAFRGNLPARSISSGAAIPETPVQRAERWEGYNQWRVIEARKVVLGAAPER